MKIQLSWRYIVAFIALTILCGTSHEFVHHFTGALLCGAFGTKTFNSFTLAAGCDDNLTKVYWAAMAGPIFTFGLMWVGLAMMRRPAESMRRMGFALVFANFPINRMLFVLLNQNDEQYANRMMFGERALIFWVTVALVWAVSLPPLIEAFRQLRNRPRVAWFAGFFILPFVFVVIFVGFLEDFLLKQRHVLATQVIGVPYLILLVEVICVVLFEMYKKSIIHVDAAAVHA